MNAPPSRAETLTRLGSERYDLLVIGAGVIGSRVAYEAAAAGWSVALIDAGDFGGATSSASSKLIHGGLRYLARGDIRLVREAHQERRALSSLVAPHLVKQLDFLIPIYRGGPQRVPVVAAGVLLYAGLSGFRQSRSAMLSPRRAAEIVPALRTEGLSAAALYMDAETHDSRLVLATVEGAFGLGARVLNHARVVDLEAARGRLGRATIQAGPEATTVTVEFGQVVNAAGPWVDRVRLMEDPAAPPMARLSKGVHITMPLAGNWRAALTIPIDSVRVSFAIPWEGMLMLGTTDTEFLGDPAQVTADEQDVLQILAEAGTAIQGLERSREQVLACFAGLRVLPVGDGTTATASREHVVAVGKRGMVSVAGGKLTTHRRIALDVLRRLPWPPPHLRLTNRALPSAAAAPAPAPPGISPALVRHLHHLYGAHVGEVLAYAGKVPEALERVHPSGLDVWAQVYRARDAEWAVTPDDVLRRRTTIALRGLDSPEVRARTARILADA